VLAHAIDNENHKNGGIDEPPIPAQCRGYARETFAHCDVWESGYLSFLNH